MPAAERTAPASLPCPPRRGGRLRYRWHRLAAHVLLVVFGLANLYPFFWMLGASLKAEDEASLQRHWPLPGRKYRLADGFELTPVLPLALADLPAGAAETDATRRAFAELKHRLTLIDQLQRQAASAAAAPPTTDARKYARISRRPLADSDRQLRRLVELGVLAELPAGPARYRLADAADGAVYKGLYPRQILTLWSMRDENRRRHESRQTSAPDSRTVQAYAAKFGLDRAAAREEVRQLARDGHLRGFYSQWINYWIVLKEENFLLHFLNSLVVTVVVVFLTVLLSSMLGYALARLRFPGKMLVLGLMIAGAVAPREAVIIPIFKMLTAAGALEGLWGMVTWLSSVGVGSALLMAGFFWTLPKEVEEAASVDGAGPFRTFFDVALPMARPIVMTVALFAFLNAWNNFLIPLLCTMTRPSMQPLAVAVYNFQRGHPGKWHQINAAASVMIVPVICMFLLVQKHVVKSIAVGAVKG